jgi:hypothetical protein
MTRLRPAPITAGQPNPTESLPVPSLRVLAVVVLVGLGASASAVNVVANSGQKVSFGRAPQALIASGPKAAIADPVFSVQSENQRKGTPGWQIPRARGTHPGLAAYAGVVSVRPGQSVPLAVSATGTVRVRAFRIGWYDGIGARQVWQGSLHARTEPADPASWQARGLADTTGWPEGHYLLRLDQGAASRYLPLTVRSADAQGRVLVLTSPLSWQAENSGSSASGKPRTASFDRPYAAGYGSGGFVEDDESVVKQAERSNKPLAYATDYDLATDPALVKKASGLVVGSDSQFWTASLRTTVAQAADAGTNLAFFGAGTGSRRVRLSEQGRAVVVPDAAPSDSVRLTGERPSCAASGSGSGSGSGSASGSGSGSGSGAASAPVADWKVAGAGWWGYDGTDVHNADVLPGLIGDGADRAATSAPGSPSALQVLSFTQLTCSAGGSASAQSAAYQVRSSGAGVFVTGTGRWACAAAGACLDPSGKPVKTSKITQRVVNRVTRNVINAFAKPEAGTRYPATASATQYTALH